MITGNALQHAEIARIVSCLCIEIRTGMKHSRGSQMNLAKHWCGSSKQTKKGVLGDLIEWFYANGGELRSVWNTVERSVPEEADKFHKRADRAAIRYQQSMGD